MASPSEARRGRKSPSRRAPVRAARDPLYDAVAQALPARELKITRDALIPALLGQIQRWLELAPQVRQYAERRSRCAELADDMRHTLERTRVVLRRLGVRESEVVANQRVHRHGAEADLYALCWSTMTRLSEWERMWRVPPKRGRRETFAAKLTESLKEYCDLAGLSVKEFADLLSAIGNSRGLPTLSAETLRKRKQRGTKAVRQS